MSPHRQTSSGASLQGTLAVNRAHSIVRAPHGNVLNAAERLPWDAQMPEKGDRRRKSYNDGSSRRLSLRESNSRIGVQRSVLRPSLATGAGPRVSHVKPQPRSVARPPTRPHGAHAPLARSCSHFLRTTVSVDCDRFVPLRGIGVAVQRSVGVVLGLTPVTLRVHCAAKIWPRPYRPSIHGSLIRVEMANPVSISEER